MSSSQTTPVLGLNKGLLILDTSANAAGAPRNRQRVLVVGGGVTGLTCVYCTTDIVKLTYAFIGPHGSCSMQDTMSQSCRSSGLQRHLVSRLRSVSISPVINCNLALTRSAVQPERCRCTRISSKAQN